MTAFIQISDTHIVVPGARVCGRSDTAEALRAAVAAINARLPLLGEVACAIVTGDLTDHGTGAEYAHFATIMAELALPWRAIPGNHDTHDGMRRAFAGCDWMPAEGPIQWLHDLGRFALIGLDTLQDGAHHGWIAEEGLTFLERCLSDLAGHPTVVATHHPCLNAGIPPMDANNLRNGAALIALLQSYPGPVRMISGHVHRAITGQIGNVTCVISPSPAHAVHRDMRAGVQPGLTLEPGGVVLHAWVEGPTPGLIADVLPVGVFPGPWPFEDAV